MFLLWSAIVAPDSLALTGRDREADLMASKRDKREEAVRKSQDV